MALLELRNVSKIYRLGGEEIRALDDVSLDIEAGEFISIVGPSGSGKSTLMHVLGCLDSPSSGTVRIDGTLLEKASAGELARIRNQKIGFVFQFFNLLPRLTVLQNVELPMIYSGVTARKRRERALHALELVQMEHRAHHRPLQLSGGQQQRTAIARALVNDPRIVFADEPTGNLDSHTGEAILEVFHALGRHGRTIVLVTHDPAVADATPRRIEIRDGKATITSSARAVVPAGATASAAVPERPPPAGRRRAVSGLLNLLSTLGVGIKEISANKFRSALTMLGIILGVGSLVAQSALVKGLENGMKEALIAIGGLEKVYVTEQAIPIWQRHRADQAVGCRMDDIHALKRSAPLVHLVTPEIRVPAVTVTRNDKAFNPWHFVGTWPDALELNQHVVKFGRMFNSVDEELARNVCVIGTGTRDALFGPPEDDGSELNPVGEFININSQRFRIIGMFQHYESELDRKAREQELENGGEPAEGGPSRRRGQGSGRSRSGAGIAFEWKNNTIYIPLTTMRVRYRSGAGANNEPDPRLTTVYFKVRDLERLNDALQQVKNVMLQTHRGIEDFAFNTQENWSENITIAIRNARLNGSIIAAISLLVGGVGIMNIMLASITERVREIGVRKAIGATFLDVFFQILIESVVIAVIGGLVGLAASDGLVELLSLLSPGANTPVITVNAMLLAFSSSVCVGVLAGIFPGLKAARLDPIQALRYE